MYDEHLDLSQPIEFSSDEERREESGLRQAHELAEQIGAFDAELAECLRLSGNEEGWHRELLEQFPSRIGGDVPVNVHFIRQVVPTVGGARRLKMKAIYHGVYAALLASAAASRRVAQAFDHIGFAELSRAYVESLGRLFLNESDLDLAPFPPLTWVFGTTPARLFAEGEVSAISVAAAEAAIDRERVVVTAN